MDSSVFYMNIQTPELNAEHQPDFWICYIHEHSNTGTLRCVMIKLLNMLREHYKSWTRFWAQPDFWIYYMNILTPE